MGCHGARSFEPRGIVHGGRSPWTIWYESEAERLTAEATRAIEESAAAKARTAFAERRLRETANSAAVLHEEHARAADKLRTEATRANERTRQALAEAIELSRALDQRDRGRS